MTKDILLGAIDNLEWNQIKPWILSAKEVGFAGDIWLITYRATQFLLDLIQKEGVNVYPVNHTRHMEPIQHAVVNSPTVSHNMRFYHAWELLERLHAGRDNERLIMTDVRDVIFQSNPIEWMKEHITSNCIIAPSEGMSYENEPWNRDNIIKGYGETFYNLVAKNWDAYNVGTIAGNLWRMKCLFHTLYSMTEGRYYPSDQSTFNVLLHSMPASLFEPLPMDAGWAVQCGTTLDPTKSFLWPNVIEPRPTVANGKVYNSKGQLFALVHQWDRVPELKAIINEKYK